MSLLDGSEPLDELLGPILNMVAVLWESKAKRRFVVLDESEGCKSAERDVVVMMSSWSWLIIGILHWQMREEQRSVIRIVVIGTREIKSGECALWACSHQTWKVVTGGGSLEKKMLEHCEVCHHHQVLQLPALLSNDLL
jgi:hypothetical protein